MEKLHTNEASSKEMSRNKHYQPTPNQQQLDDDSEMTFLDHLEELRWHIIRSLIAIAVVGIVLFIFNEWLFDVVLFGPTHPEFVSYDILCNVVHWYAEQVGSTIEKCFHETDKFPEFKKQAIGFAEAFVTSIKVSFIAGFVFAFPYVFWEIWQFIKPGLYPEEQKAARGVVYICSFLFLLGVVFGYFIIAPFAVNFLGNYTIPGVENITTLDSFIKFMVMFTLPAGLIFQLPVLVYFLSRVGLITADIMKKYRKHAIIGILLLAALLTPPDVVTQFLIGIPLFFLYEISILVAKRVEKELERREREEEARAKGEKPPVKGRLELLRKFGENLFKRNKKKTPQKKSKESPITTNPSKTPTTNQEVKDETQSKIKSSVTSFDEDDFSKLLPNEQSSSDSSTTNPESTDTTSQEVDSDDNPDADQKTAGEIKPESSATDEVVQDEAATSDQETDHDDSEEDAPLDEEDKKEDS